MRAKRAVLFTMAVAAAIGCTLVVAGPGFAKGGAGGGAGGGGASGGGSSGGGSNTKKPPEPKKTILDDMEKEGSISTFTAAVKAAGLDATLKGNGPFTVFAPNNAAFTKIEAKWQELCKPENKAKLKSLLERHIAPAKKKLADIAKDTRLTAGGVTHEIKLDDEKKPLIDGAHFVKEDLGGSNGWVHVIDAVLLPVEKPAATPAPPADK